jgi:hypothetical protein
LASTTTLKNSAVYIHRRTRDDVITFNDRTTGLCQSALAWTSPVRHGWIRLCRPQFFQLLPGTPPGIHTNSQPGTILHEVAHNAGIAVGDHRSAPPAADIRGSWAEDHTWSAKHNADSYEYAALECAFGWGRYRCD